jgi:rod shape-determining protein MreC
MRQLFLFFYNYRAFFTFILLELVAAWLIITNNQYQSSAFYNTANSTVGQVLQATNNVSEYFDLKEVNKDLALENAKLKAQLEEMNQRKYLAVDSIYGPEVISQYQFKVAKVINNTTNLVSNYITVNKGTADGIKPGMGAIGPKGVVGMVKNCSEHFSTIISVLHIENRVSSKIKKNKAFCTTKWDGKNPKLANILYLPKHIKIAKGDSVVTSDENLVYPEGIMVGVIKKVRDDVQVESPERITVELSTDFNKLEYIYLVDNRLKKELDSLNIKTKGVEK